ncbi:MAG: hypothetical protein LBU28_11285 [Spirochaetaceae bacterium]|nr:hypothetical protein [Spirochaetaceae bacterium]
MGTVFFFLVSCTRAAPQIAYGFIQLVYYQTSGQIEERFSFFVLPDDEDGLEDLRELYLYHDKEGLAWSISADEWIIYEEDGKTWIGSRGITMLGGGVLPRGQYRAVLMDKGGEKSERSFSFDAPEKPRFPFPRLTLAQGQYQLESQYPQNYFICYDRQGEVITTLRVTNSMGVLGDLGLPSNTGAVSLWAEDEEYMTSAYTEPLAIR